MNSPPRRTPPRRIVSSPGTPVGTRSRGGRPVWSVPIVFVTRPKRECHGEGRADTCVAWNCSFDAHCADELARYPKPYPESAVVVTFPTECVEPLENLRLITVRYSDPFVPHRKARQITVAC